MDRFESMSAFVAVVQAGSFSTASRRLGAPLASVSRRVAELEEQLGAQLLARSTRKITLTEGGRQFFEASRALLERLGEAERAASGQYQTPRGKLVMTLTITFGRQQVLPIVWEFLAAFPEVEIEARMTARFFNLAEHGIDLAVWVRELPDPNHSATFVGSLAQVICASPDYLAQRGRPRHPRDLAMHDCVLYAGLDMNNEWAFTIDGVRELVPVRGRLRTSSAEAAFEAALAGAGFIRSGAHAVARAIADGQLVPVLAGFEPAPFPVYVVLPANRTPSPTVNAFVDFLIPRLEGRLKALATSSGLEAAG